MQEGHLILPLFILYFKTNSDKTVICKDITNESEQVAKALYLRRHGTGNLAMNKTDIIPILMGYHLAKETASQEV